MTTDTVRYERMDEPIGDLHSESLNNVVDRLQNDFLPDLTLAAVIGTVRRCRRELDVVKGPALPELVERLARQRLQNHRDAMRPRAARRGVRPQGPLSRLDSSTR